MATLPRKPRVLTISSFDATLGAGLRKCRLDSLSFIDAYGLVGMAIAMRAGLAGGEKVEVTAPARRGMREHLAAMGFDAFLRQFDHAALETEAETMESSGVVVPLRSAADAGGEQAISQLLWDQLRDQVDPQVLAALGEGVWEMVANALEHSSSDASVMAQVYRSSRHGQPPDHDDKVQVVIGDAGRGIRAALASSPHYAPESDLEAIELALEYLVSSVHEDPGRGQGLSTTAEQVAGLGGKVVIRSGEGKLTLAGQERSTEAVPSLPGTIVALSLPLYPGS
jgi:hypothetical protein